MVQKQNIYSDYDSVKKQNFFSILIFEKKGNSKGNSFVAIDNAKITAAPPFVLLQ
jgi:hypothetical protein